MSVPERLTVRGVSKSFGPVHAVRGVSFSVRAGAVHALVGENGAGKSTLVKMITGMERPDAGELLLDGEPCRFETPIDARRRGITAVYQDPRLFPHLDVAENIFMGIQPRTRLGLVDGRRMYEEAGRRLSELGVDIDPRSLLAGRTVAEVQFVEIVRAMCADLRLLILDEPTASLTPAEAERLFGVVRGLQARGVATLFISHRLEEVRRIADDVTVMRDGEHVITTGAAGLSEEAMVRHMVGRELSALFTRKAPAAAPPPGPPAFEVRGLGLPGAFDDVSFSVRAGEIVGLAGLVGAGRTEIAEAVFGIRPPARGLVVVGGEEVRPTSPRQMLEKGVAYIPEDRDAHGLVVELGVASNVCLAVLDRLARGGLLGHGRETAFARPFADDFEIKAASLDAPVGSLSGGNRQKVVLAKWLATRPKVLILDEPTHGIDVGTKSQVHQRISELSAAGYPVLLISSDLPEVLALCDRILVVARGRVVAELSREEATQERILTAAALSGRAAGAGVAAPPPALRAPIRRPGHDRRGEPGSGRGHARHPGRALAQRPSPAGDERLLLLPGRHRRLRPHHAQLPHLPEPEGHRLQRLAADRGRLRRGDRGHHPQPRRLGGQHHRPLRLRGGQVRRRLPRLRPRHRAGGGAHRPAARRGERPHRGLRPRALHRGHPGHAGRLPRRHLHPGARHRGPLRQPPALDDPGGRRHRVGHPLRGAAGGGGGAGAAMAPAHHPHLPPRLRRGLEPRRGRLLRPAGAAGGALRLRRVRRAGGPGRLPLRVAGGHHHREPGPRLGDDGAGGGGAGRGLA